MKIQYNKKKPQGKIHIDKSIIIIYCSQRVAKKQNKLLLKFEKFLNFRKSTEMQFLCAKSISEFDMN